MPEVLKMINGIFFAAAAVSAVMAAAKYVLQSHDCRAARECASGRKIIPAEKYRIIILAGTFVAAFAIRIWQFGLIPGGINQDGAMAAVDGKALADYATDRFGTFMPAHLQAWGYGQMSCLLSYLIAVFVKIWGLNVITARLPQLIVSMAGGVFFYLFVKDLFGKNTGLAAAVFVAVNPWHFLQSRWAIDCNLLPHFFIAAMYFFNKGMCKKKYPGRIFIYVSMVLFALCMYCYGVTVYTIPPLLLVMAVYYTAGKRLKLSEVFLGAGIYILVAWPFLLTMAVNYFKWDTIKLPFVTIPYFPDSVRSRDILLFSENPLGQLGANIRALLNATLLQKKDLPWNDMEGFGTMYLCTMPFVFAGFVQFARQKTEGIKSLAVFTLLAGIMAGLLTNNVNVNRINLVYYGMMIFAVLGIVFTVRAIQGFLWMDMAMYAVLAGMMVFTYFGSYADMIGNQFYEGFGDALMRTEASGAQRIYVTADTQYEGSYSVSEILTLFYDATDAEYFQEVTNENKGIERWPYSQRFIYADITEELARRTVEEDASYVIRSGEKDYFDGGLYEIISYGAYSAVVPR